jgi:hypothetical protein
MRADFFSFLEQSSEGTPKMSARNLPFWGQNASKKAWNDGEFGFAGAT